MRITTVTDDVLILLGKQGEINAQEIRFPVVDSWQNTYGADGTFSVLLQRPTEDAPYPKSCTIADGCVCIVIDNADNALAGIGLLELQYIVNGNLAKSHTWQTKVFECLGTAADPPEPWESWVDEILQAASDASESAESASQSAEDADGYAEDSEAWAVGQRDGSDVPSTDPAYHNNAKYYASQYIGRHGEGEHAEVFNRYAEDFPDDHNIAEGDFSHAENGAEAYGNYSHAENGAEAYGNYSHAEGKATASGKYSHAEGEATADTYCSHAEGKATAGGFCSHAQGSSVTDGNYSHAGGYGARANSDAGFAHGYEVQNSRFVAGNAIFGAFGQSAPDDMFAVANGQDIDHKNIAFRVKKNGDAMIAGANITQTASGDDVVITFA